MRTLRFPRHVYPVAIGRDLVLFDSACDRYVALPGAVSEGQETAVDVGLSASTLLREAADALLGAGLLSAEQIEGPLPDPIPQPRHVIASDGTRSATLIDLLRLAAAVVQGRSKLKLGLPCDRFTRVRGRPSVASMSELRSAVGRLRAARLLVPHPRRCLPASIVAALFLRGLHQEVEIVFGVRSHPFEAHCWIERDGIVLDDDLDRVCSFTPIAVGHL